MHFDNGITSDNSSFLLPNEDKQNSQELAGQAPTFTPSQQEQLAADALSKLTPIRKRRARTPKKRQQAIARIIAANSAASWFFNNEAQEIMDPYIINNVDPLSLFTNRPDLETTNLNLYLTNYHDFTQKQTAIELFTLKIPISDENEPIVKAIFSATKRLAKAAMLHDWIEAAEVRLKNKVIKDGETTYDIIQHDFDELWNLVTKANTDRYLLDELILFLLEQKGFNQDSIKLLPIIERIDSATGFDTFADNIDNENKFVDILQGKRYIPTVVEYLFSNLDEFGLSERNAKKMVKHAAKLAKYETELYRAHHVRDYKKFIEFQTKILCLRGYTKKISVAAAIALADTGKVHDMIENNHLEKAEKDDAEILLFINMEKHYKILASVTPRIHTQRYNQIYV